MLETLQDLDVQLLQIFNGWGTTAIDPFWLFVTKVWVWIPFLLFLFFLALKKLPKEHRLTVAVGFAVMLAIVLGLTELVKQLVERVRPCNNVLLNGLFREPIHPTDYSFFSGHTATSISMAVFFIALTGKVFKPVYVLILWAILFAFSRLYLAAHFPSDILAGGLVGFSIAKLFVFRIKRKLKVG